MNENKLNYLLNYLSQLQGIKCMETNSKNITVIDGKMSKVLSAIEKELRI